MIITERDYGEVCAELDDVRAELERAREKIRAADQLAQVVETFGACYSITMPAASGPLLAACAAYRAKGV